MSVGRSCAGTRRNSRGSIGFGGIRWFREQGENHDRESVGSHIFVVWGGTHRRRRRGRRALAVILDRGTCEGRKIVAMRQIRRRVPLDSRRVARPRSGCGQTGLLSSQTGLLSSGGWDAPAAAAFSACSDSFITPSFFGLPAPTTVRLRMMDDVTAGMAIALKTTSLDVRALSSRARGYSYRRRCQVGVKCAVDECSACAEKFRSS